MKRKNPSKAASIFESLNILGKNVLDYGCGYGFDAEYYNWDKYDPYYFDYKIIQIFTNVKMYMVHIFVWQQEERSLLKLVYLQA